MRSRPAAWLTLYGRTYPALEDVAERDAFTAGEAEFIAPRDSFYMPTLTGHGCPTSTIAAARRASFASPGGTNSSSPITAATGR